jgi:hypothetical protein
MVDALQILLTVVISVLTVLLTIIGIALFQILREFKGSIERINKILDDTGRITESVAEPIEQASEFILGLKKGIAFFRNISDFFNKDKKRSRHYHSDKAEDIDDYQEDNDQAEEKPIPVSKKSSKKSSKKEAKKEKVEKLEKDREEDRKKRFFTKKGQSLGG